MRNIEYATNYIRTVSPTSRPLEVDEYINEYTVVVDLSGRERPEGTVEVRTDDGEVVPGRVLDHESHGRRQAVVELLVSEFDSYREIL